MIKKYTAQDVQQIYSLTPAQAIAVINAAAGKAPNNRRTAQVLVTKYLATWNKESLDWREYFKLTEEGQEVARDLAAGKAITYSVKLGTQPTLIQIAPAFLPLIVGKAIEYWVDGRCETGIVNLMNESVICIERM